MALGTHIANLRHHSSGQLLLDIQVVVLHVWSAYVSVEGKGIALEIARGRIPKYRCSRDHRSANYTCGENGRRSDWVISRPGIEERCIGEMSEEEILGKRIVENAETTAHNCLTGAENVPGRAHAGCKIPVIRVIKLVQSRGPYPRQSKGCGGGVETSDVTEQIVLLGDHPKIVPAHTEIERKAGGCPIAVLNKKTVAILEGVTK